MSKHLKTFLVGLIVVLIAPLVMLLGVVTIPFSLIYGIGAALLKEGVKP